MNIERTKAGSELDAMVAEKVMGLDVSRADVWCPEYSTDIAAAWEVVEKLSRYGFALHTPRAEEKGVLPWRCTFAKDLTGWGHMIEAETAPLAICIAAFKALGES